MDAVKTKFASTRAGKTRSGRLSTGNRLQFLKRKDSARLSSMIVNVSDELCLANMEFLDTPVTPLTIANCRSAALSARDKLRDFIRLTQFYEQDDVHSVHDDEMVFAKLTLADKMKVCWRLLYRKKADVAIQCLDDVINGSDDALDRTWGPLDSALGELECSTL